MIKTPELPVLLVDDDEEMLLSYQKILKNSGLNNLLSCPDSTRVADLLREQDFSAVILDLDMPRVSGQDVLSLVKRLKYNLPVIVSTGINRVETAVECLKLGASDYLTKPVDKNRLLSSLSNALEITSLRLQVDSLKSKVLDANLKHPEVFRNILTACEKMMSVFRYIEAVAPSPRPVLITGESGCGKELIARAIHNLSGRSGSFVAVNIAGLDDTVFSDTLFGHKKGAFTGADAERSGLIEKASAGTLFLDEIGDLESASQIKLFRLLQEKEYYKMGSDIVQLADTRIVAATSVKLDEKITAGKFRGELFYRLMTHNVSIPALRERPEDIPVLVQFFVREAAQTLNKESLTIPAQVMETLLSYTYPGNIRELQALLFNAVTLSEGTELESSYISEYMQQHPERRLAEHHLPSDKIHKLLNTLPNLPTIQEMEETLISLAMERTAHNQSEAARMLGVSQSTLSRRTK